MGRRWADGFLGQNFVNGFIGRKESRSMIEFMHLL